MARKQSPTEYTKVEKPLMDQLALMGWEVLEGDIDVPDFTERQSFRDVLLKDRLRTALAHINRTDDGEIWLDDMRISQAVSALERGVSTPKLLETNTAATELLLKGTVVPGDQDIHGGKDTRIRYIDYECPENNNFLVINQFRVDPPGLVGDKGFRIPDLVLFVNGIPLVVIECKSPQITTPMEKGIRQLLLYSNQREEVQDEEGTEKLFWYNQFVVSTHYYEARVATITAFYDHYVEWKRTDPVARQRVLAELGVEHLVSQQTLVAGMLRPGHLLDIVRHFTLFTQHAGQTIKIVGRYQQFSAVHEAIRRLQEEPTRLEDGEFDRRGGIIWHTQGSGKSLTMVFLVRKMRTMPELRRFKVVIVTDRTDLEDQLADTATLTGETVIRAQSTAQLRRLLQQEGPGLIFGMIQKYRDFDGALDTEDAFPELNDSEDVLVLVDEAHRSHTNEWHANLLAALPNSARIGFTGTPIIVGAKKKTHEIFGSYIDVYTIKQSEEDGVTVPIVYEGRTADAVVADGRSMDQLFDDMFAERTEEEREAIKSKHATEHTVLESERLIKAKARDMLRHYVSTILPNGFKAQLVAVSRLAAVRYQAALAEARDELLEIVANLDPALLDLPEEELLSQYGEDTLYLVNAHDYIETIRRLEFAAVISGDQHDEPFMKEWSDRAKSDSRIARFKKPLVDENPARQDGLAFLCVRTMLLTGFDAPLEQVMYLDRFMQGYELLQAVARVNRTAPGKSRGFIVDYYGVTRHLKEALDVYSDEDVEGALTSIKDEVPKLADRHRRVLSFFQEHGISDIYDEDACIFLLEDERLRAEFLVKLRQFLESVDIVLPRPEALPYIADAKQLGFISRSAANLYRDSELSIAGVKHKVRKLIDDHIRARDMQLTVGPLSIMDAEFEKAVGRHKSDRAKAAEMEHALRYHITVHLDEDPVYYTKLSERLEAILEQFKDNWEAQAEALADFVQEQEARTGRPADVTGLSPRTQAPFLSILAEEVGGEENLSKRDLRELADITVEMVDHISSAVRQVDFWRNTPRQDELRGWLVRYLDRKDVVPYERLRFTATRIVELARSRHTELVEYA